MYWIHVNHPVTQQANGTHSGGASLLTQIYNPPVLGYALAISASDMADKVVKKDTTTQPQMTPSYIHTPNG